MQEVVTPEDVMAKEATSHEQLVIHLLVRRRLERVNKALKVEWTDAEKIMGRQVTLKHLTLEEYKAVVQHYKAAGWKVGVSPTPGAPDWEDTSPSWMRKHPYLKTLVFIFAMPASSFIGKKHPPRNPDKVYANPYSEPMYRGGEVPVTREDEFEAALRGDEAVKEAEGEEEG